MFDKIKIAAWYINPERIAQLIGPNADSYLQEIGGAVGTQFGAGPIGRARYALQDLLEKWLYKNKIPSIEESLLKQTAKPGDFFSIYHDFYAKNLKRYAHLEVIPRDAVAELHCKSKVLPDYKIRILYHPNNITVSSGWARLSERSRLFVFAYIEKIEGNEIIGRPLIIGDIHYGFNFDPIVHWPNDGYGEIAIDSIENFAEISRDREKFPSQPDLNILKTISEDKIKRSIAEIIHEENVPKDWGGEKSDLFTTNVKYNNLPVSTAFLFKGPAQFSEMTLATLGKNGDQIDRLYTEPAKLLILQHVHRIAPTVRNTMKTYAFKIGDLRLFSIIDGYDTIRLLRAYKKCGI